MKRSELQRVLRDADSAAVLVSPRVLARVIEEVYDLPNLMWHVPHRKSCVVDRQILFRHVEQEELELESDQLLPDKVLLLERPSAEELNSAKPETLLVTFWQRLFHLKIHEVLERRFPPGALTSTDLDARIEQLGPAEFAEIQNVLVEERYLLPAADRQVLYIEFAAVFLELRYFASNLLASHFPGISDWQRIEALLARDVDAATLYRQTRLAGAPEALAPIDTTSDEAHEYFRELVAESDVESRRGNLVKAAIGRMQATRVAPGDRSTGTHTEAVQFLQQLLARLQKALELTDDEVNAWGQALPILLDKSDQGTAPVEAALLYDLQKACLDFEQDIYALDLVEWLLSAGRRPIKRPLPSQRLVRVIRHLRQAAQRLTLARLSDTDRAHLAGLLDSAQKRCAQRLRANFRPVLATALEDVGLTPRNALERTAFHKVIEQILDRITEHGFLTFSDLRDTLSRSQLKLADLGDPQEFIRGDPLLRLDRRLKTLLDGVYRPSEIYSRWLERFTALNFGTMTGRLLTLFVTLPVGGAFLIVEGINLVLGWVRAPALPAPAYYTTLVLLTVVLLGLIHRREVRRRFVQAGRALLGVLRTACIDVPLAALRLPPLRRVVHSWIYQLFSWYLVKPLVVSAVLWFFLPEAFENPVSAVGIFLAVVIVLNSRLGHAVHEILNQSLVRLLELLRAGLIPGLVRLVIRLFKKIIELMEKVLFTVDEFLRFRAGDGRASMIARTILGVLWFPIAYVARFYLVVLVEPGFNPIKFPISSIAAKLIYPFSIAITAWLIDISTPIMGYFLARFVFAPTTMFLLPDAFGFLVWEMKENWSLYGLNRPESLRPVAVGGHGETVRRLLQPGFHSGTIPKLFARLRHAERQARRSGHWARPRVYQHELSEVEQAVREFAARDLVFLVNQAASWKGHELSPYPLPPGERVGVRGLEVGRVVLVTNRITIELTSGQAPTPVALELEACNGWLVAQIRETGWLATLPDEQCQAFHAALASFYKFAGVDLVREQIERLLPGETASYEIQESDLLIWPEPTRLSVTRYPLREAAETDGPHFFRRLPLSWRRCLAWWQADQEGATHPPLDQNGTGLDLLPRERSAPTDSSHSSHTGTPLVRRNG